MKINIIILTIYAILFLGCKKSNPSNPLGMSAKINSIPWSSTTYEASIDSTGSGLTSLSIHGYDTNYIYINIGINNFSSATGKFDITTVDNQASYYIFYPGYASPKLYAYSVSGDITIISVTGKNIKGTFNFKAIDDRTGDTYSITDGQFNVNTQ